MTVNDSIENIVPWRRIQAWWGRYGRAFGILYGFAVVVYLPMLALRLTNDMDGLWGQDDYVAGTWELSIGRWFWPYLDKIRFHLSLDPLPGLLALVLYVSGFLMIVSMLVPPDFRWKGRQSLPGRQSLSIYLAGTLFLASTGIACQMSYSYMVITFAVSFWLAVAAVRIVAPSAGWKRICASGLVIAVMMGCYQSSVGVTALVALFVFLAMLVRRDDCKHDSIHNKDREDLNAGRLPDQESGSSQIREFNGETKSGVRAALGFAARMLMALVIGAVLYEILLHLHFAVFHTEAAQYQGFAEITPLYILQNLPHSIRHTYTALMSYSLGQPFQFHALVTRRWFRILYLVPAGIVVWQFLRVLRGSGAVSAALFLAGVLLLPHFANGFFLLAPDAETQMQTTVPMSLILPLILTMPTWERINAEDGRCRKGSRWKKAAAVCCLVVECFLVYGAIGQVEIDSYAMYAGRRASETLGKSIVSGMQAAGQDYISGQVLIVGNPADSQTFVTTDLYERANNYAQYGRWPEDVATARICWSRLFDNELRMNLSYVVTDTGESIAAAPEVAAMPVFPAVGSIQNIYGVTVVKLHE